MQYDIRTYCPLAFTGFDTRSKSACCWARISEKPRSFKELQDTITIKNLQTDLLNGVKNPTCNACWQQEETGVISMRQHFMRQHFLDIDKAIEQEIVDKKLKHLVIDSGNVCNLACRTCGSHSSSSHFKESNAKDIKFGRKEQILTVKKTDLEYLKSEDYSSINTISVLGGEPFQNLEHLEILDIIVKQGYASNCKLYYCTNGTIKLPKRVKDIFCNFRQVQFTLSVDAICEQFEYIRTNGEWPILLDNVADLKDLAKNNINVGIDGHPTTSALNILYLDELYEWYEENNLNYNIVICESPVAYSFKIFNDVQKEIILAKLADSRFDMTAIIQHIRNSSFNQAALDNFYREIEFTKEFKNLDINEYLPRLMELLEQ
jgi:MoaA/NifB/PqqE/SkfB family radical SAM enzyme